MNPISGGATFFIAIFEPGDIIKGGEHGRESERANKVGACGP